MNARQMTCAPLLSASERPTELHDKAGPLSALTPSAREPSIGGEMGSKQHTLDPGPLLLQHSPTETLVDVDNLDRHLSNLN